MTGAWSFQSLFPARYQALKKRYDEPGRFYHTWEHIAALLDFFEELRGSLHDPQPVELAIYYHDAIYDPLAGDNEAASAALLNMELSNELPPEVIRNSSVLIEATAGHQLPDDEEAELLSDCACFLDMDISILGTEQNVYGQYEDAIRREYAAVPEQLFKAGRARILQGFLDRPSLYFTEYFRSRFEDQARLNLAAAIQNLSQ